MTGSTPAIHEAVSGFAKKRKCFCAVLESRVLAVIGKKSSLRSGIQVFQGNPSLPR